MREAFEKKKKLEYAGLGRLYLFHYHVVLFPYIPYIPYIHCMSAAL